MRRLVLVVLAVLLIAGCSGSPPPAAAPSPSTPSPTPTPTPTATPKPRPVPPAVNPLTGLRGVPKRPVIAVKIDDTSSGRPQIGLEYADLVYVEQVEGGATRLAAVFASRQPSVVGPVRSVRNSDPELLAQYGRPALAYSGGAATPVARLRASTVTDAGPQRQGAAYRRLGSRRAPYNLVVDTARLAASLRGVTGPRDIGLRWSHTDARLATARRVSAVSITVGTNRLDFRWQAGTRRWVLVNRDGTVRRTAGGRPISTPNLLVPFSAARLDPTDVDVLGTPSVYTSTVGAGRLLLFRDGRVLAGSWARRRPASRTTYLDGRHRPITLDPGGAWVLLAATGAPVTYR